MVEDVALTSTMVTSAGMTGATAHVTRLVQVNMDEVTAGLNANVAGDTPLFLTQVVMISLTFVAAGPKKWSAVVQVYFSCVVSSKMVGIADEDV